MERQLTLGSWQRLHTGRQPSPVEIAVNCQETQAHDDKQHEDEHADDKP